MNNSNNIEFNQKGYLINFNAWSKDFALDIAKEHQLKLTDCHWRIINFLRDYYLEYGVAPEPREVIKKLGNIVHPDEPCSKSRLESLFAEGGCKLACKIAGLPNCYCRGI